MADNFVPAHAGLVTDIGTTQRNPLGFKIYGDDGSEYTYCEGVASTVAGDWVTITKAYAIVRLAANAVGKVGVAVSALVASNYGFVCTKSPRSGLTLTRGEATTTDLPLYIDATTVGAVDDASVAANLIHRAWSRSTITGAGLTLTAEFDNPFVDGNTVS